MTTDICTYYYEYGKSTRQARGGGSCADKIEQIVGTKFGDPDDPLLVSVRSGARSSMPGMMETVLNVGLCSTTIPGLIAKTATRDSCGTPTGG